MADLIRHMEEGHETADIDGVIDEVAEARGTYDSLDDRLDAMGDAPSPSSSTPAMDGTASAGESDEFARGDHVHPHDTTKQDTVLGSWTPDTSATHQTPAGTDTVLEALQKIDRNQRADETNISSSLDSNGTKNLIPMSRDSIKSVNPLLIWTGYTASNVGGLNFAINEDCSITISGTTTSATIEFNIIRRADNVTFLSNGDYVICGDFTSETVFLGVNRTSGGSGVRYATSYGTPVEFTVNDAPAANGVWIGINATVGTTISLTIKPMICQKSLYDISSTYQPYAFSNTTITHALIECVDNGKKNLLPNKGSLSNDGITYTWVNGNVSVSGTKTTGVNYVDVIPLTPLTDLELSDRLVISNNGTNCYISIILWSQSLGYTSSYDVISGSDTIDIPAGYTHILARLGVKSAVTGTISETIKPMICTKEQWDISQKYVPYAVDNATLTAADLFLKDNITTLRFTNGIPRSISFSRYNYQGFIALGFVQGVGVVFWVCTINNTGSLTVNDMLTGNAVTQSTLSYTHNGVSGTLAISSSVSDRWSYLTIIKNAEIT